MKLKWKMRNGDKILISKMTNEHLMNTIKMLKRNAEYKKDYLDILYCQEPGLQGEMAIDRFENEQQKIWDSTWEDYVPEVYFDLLKQADKRKMETKEFYGIENAEEETET